MPDYLIYGSCGNPECNLYKKPVIVSGVIQCVKEEELKQSAYQFTCESCGKVSQLSAKKKTDK